VLLRTPQPMVVPNMPAIPGDHPPLVAGTEWPEKWRERVAEKIVALGSELGVPVCDHYTAWLSADTGHVGPSVCNPNKLWMLMSDATHPGPLGHLFFYRQLAPFFGLREKLPWEL
jgi:lysophospholipase L1-like esterase